METTKKEELIIVKSVRDGKYNLIDANGKLLSEQWFNWVGTFHDGFVIVERGDSKYNFIDKQGKILLDEWFEWIGVFYDGFARVKRFDGSMNFINKELKIISDEWFSYVDYFDEYGLAGVQRSNGEQAKIDKNGKIS